MKEKTLSTVLYVSISIILIGFAVSVFCSSCDKALYEEGVFPEEEVLETKSSEELPLNEEEKVDTVVVSEWESQVGGTVVFE